MKPRNLMLAASVVALVAAVSVPGAFGETRKCENTPDPVGGQNLVKGNAEDECEDIAV